MSLEKEAFDVIIKPRTSWFNLELRELFKFRFLLWIFVRRDFVVTHAQSVLGPIWYFLTPIISTFVFVVVFGKISQIPTDGLPDTLFYMSGLSIWNYFVACVSKNTDSLGSNLGLFSKVYFPRVIPPISIVLGNLVSYTTQFIVLIFTILIFSSLYEGSPPIKWTIVFIPVVLIFTGMLGLALGLISSALTAKYKDVVHVFNFILTMLMYASPVVYPASRIPEYWSSVFLLNPMAGIIETYRFLIFGSGSIPWSYIPINIATIIFLFFLGTTLYHYVEKNYVDTA